jgi:hypothetical protein
MRICDDCPEVGPKLVRTVMQKLVDTRNNMKTHAQLIEDVKKLLGDNGCDCTCDHHPTEHEDDCERCLACRIEKVLSGA